MSARTKRTAYRLVALFLAAGAGDAIVQFATAGLYDWRHLTGALVAAAVLALEKWLSESDSTVAAPTVAGVNVALETQAASVPLPSMPVPNPVT